MPELNTIRLFSPELGNALEALWRRTFGEGQTPGMGKIREFSVQLAELLARIGEQHRLTQDQVDDILAGTSPAFIELYSDGTLVGTRSKVNLVAGSNITLAGLDDAIKEWAQITITAATAGGIGADATLLWQWNQTDLSEFTFSAGTGVVGDWASVVTTDGTNTEQDMVPRLYFRSPVGSAGNNAWLYTTDTFANADGLLAFVVYGVEFAGNVLNDNKGMLCLGNSSPTANNYLVRMQDIASFGLTKFISSTAYQQASDVSGAHGGHENRRMIMVVNPNATAKFGIPAGGVSFAVNGMTLYSQKTMKVTESTVLSSPVHFGWKMEGNALSGANGYNLNRIEVYALDGIGALEILT